MARLPGQTSTLALLTSSLWAISALFILIVGHLVWIFIIYGMMTNTDALKDLTTFIPALHHNHMYILAGLALLADLWILISPKR
ncbi:MAG: hypothetical protein Q9N67_00190 [Ghiorsea sp.]|nr:hypothetical protein [Ghiorsea sp.]